jgi:glucose-6-phosphate 1-epimerase
MPATGTGPLVDALNARYTVAGVSFAQGSGGLPVVEIANDFATARVALLGATVLAFEPRGQRPVLWVSRESRFTPGKAIRGGIPICWPWFGDHPSDTSKPAHGFARTSDWTVAGVGRMPDGSTRLTLGLSDSAASRAVWPHAFEAEAIVSIGKALEVDVRARNTGTEPFTCTGALHSYFAIGEIGRVKVHGLDALEYIDKVARFQRFAQAGPVTITGETDRIYLGTTADCVIDDSAWQRKIRIAKRGSHTTVVWNPWIEKARQLADFGDDEYHEMICVETTNAADDQITVPPGTEHHLVTRISLE